MIDEFYDQLWPYKQHKELCCFEFGMYACVCCLFPPFQRKLSQKAYSLRSGEMYGNYGWNAE